ncbi:MAG: tRNA (adenosine(37)-N6)-threonylcarbamoyltransferase complex ATPase subunit type 1 TsaE [Elusimicrobiaceae bacterium]|nr:tRNA (adenosine(37)-N6)-threonylcarbamoyltransferase complex ATPase subunit type 1 TsaE [Elusimicrobiaceae bacterium]
MKKGLLKTSSCEQTQALAARFAKSLRGGEIVFLRGPIGAGKTVFVKGIAKALGLKGSPTSASFSLMKEYKNKKFRLFHIDLFRLEENEVFNLGFEEMLEDEKAIILAEWPDPIRHLLPQDRLEMNFILKEGDNREIELSSLGPVSDICLEALCR